MKFLFIYPSSGKLEIAPEKLLSTGAWLPPLGILYLAKILEINGHTVDVIDCNAEGTNLESIKKAILSSDAVGMTVYSEERELECSIKMADFVKKTDQHIPILIGGPHCSMFPELALKQHHADLCVQGSADHVIIPLVEAIQGKRELSTIPGICYKDGNKISHTKPSAGFKDMDMIPFPSRHLVDKYDYGYMLGVKVAKGKTTSICAAQGCPFHCSFCNLHVHVPIYKSRSVNNIIEEIDEIIDQGYKTLAFVDDNFMVQPKNVEKIMEYIIQKDADLKIWLMGARADVADRNLYQKMRDAGVEHIAYGLESGNQDVLDFYNKKLTIQQIRETVNLASEMGFFITATFILGAPIETKEHIQNTIKFAKSLPLSGVTFYPLGYGYMSDIWKKEVNDEKIKPNEYLVYCDSQRGLGYFTTEEIMKYTIKAQRSFYMSPRLWIRSIKHAFSKKDFRNLRLGWRLIFD